MEKRTIYTILSYVEWIIALLLFTIHYLSFHASGKYEFFFVTSIYGGFHLVIFTKIYLQAVKEDEEEITGPILFIVICGVVMYTVCAILTFMTYQYTKSYGCAGMFDVNIKCDRFLWKAILSAVQAAIFSFDAVFRIMNQYFDSM